MGKASLTKLGTTIKQLLTPKQQPKVEYRIEESLIEQIELTTQNYEYGDSLALETDVYEPLEGIKWNG
jgi:hypothetical protein